MPDFKLKFFTRATCRRSHLDGMFTRVFMIKEFENLCYLKRCCPPPFRRSTRPRTNREAARATGAEQCAPLQSEPRRREDTAGAVAEATSDKDIHGHAYHRPNHGPAVAAPAPGEAAAAAIVW